MSSILRTGPRAAGPYEILFFVGAFVLVFTDQMTSVPLAESMERVWPTGSAYFYGVIGVGAIAGIFAVIGRRRYPDNSRLISRWLAFEAAALTLLAAMYSIRLLGCFVIGVTATNAAVDSAIFVLASAWRVRQIWVDLSELRDTEEAVAQSIADTKE